jgi:hypothetical protein
MIIVEDVKKKIRELSVLDENKSDGYGEVFTPEVLISRMINL